MPGQRARGASGEMSGSGSEGPRRMSHCKAVRKLLYDPAAANAWRMSSSLFMAAAILGAFFL
jgi:hypothetical protein